VEERGGKGRGSGSPPLFGRKLRPWSLTTDNNIIINQTTGAERSAAKHGDWADLSCSENCRMSSRSLR